MVGRGNGLPGVSVRQRVPPIQPCGWSWRVDTFVLFSCRRCRGQVRICRSCYRGHQFCEPCAPVARRESCRTYALAHRGTLAGKLGNARRQSEYRKRVREQRRKAAGEPVTHHGSPGEPLAGELGLPSAAAPSFEAATPVSQPEEAPHAIPVVAAPVPVRTLRCSFCGHVLPEFAVRPGFAPPAQRRGARPRRSSRRRDGR